MADAVLETLRTQVDARLDELLPMAQTAPQPLHEAMRYAVLGPGKRLRPALAMAACIAADGDPADALDPACAVELVHAFSLVHDDLPAIDDDDLRRGRPTVHKAFGEGLAILAGDAIFALAFQTLAGLPDKLSAPCLGELARATGSEGLVGGEVLDVFAEGRDLDIQAVEQIHRLKTGSLIGAACAVGGVCARASKDVVDTLRAAGQDLGLAFQIVDDVLNEVATPEQLGKAAGSDRDRKKATYPSVVGVEESMRLARSLAESALDRVAGLGGDAAALCRIATLCVERES